ncbi:AB hydrolase superfamily protein [Colletotrichum spinosum]|uniref:AB hydrolase superfamily protein n=1 Tax=Colletotrichum spinosum TaxID=1347390 RepID=A0A4R8QGS1_9PEZI|nr:AB hydrolase superfamily protein [Colletotrichum spinosum]
MKSKSPRFTEFLANDGKEFLPRLEAIPDTMFRPQAATRQAVPGTRDSAREFDVQIPMRDGYENPARVFKPEVSVNGRPCVVLVHGGGFTIGHPTHVAHYSRALTKLFGVTVINITYRLAPDHKFPAAPNDVWDSVNWIFSEHPRTRDLGDFTKTSFILGGVSAGANLAAVTAQKWFSAKRSPRLVGIWLTIPWLLEREIVPGTYEHLWLSRGQNTDTLIINTATAERIRELYSPEIMSTDFSPFNDKNAHKGLCPVYFQVCGQDAFRDDGMIYEKMLRDNGVLTKMNVYPGLPHGFADVMPTFNLTSVYHADSAKGFGWLLGVEVTDEEVNLAIRT